MVAAWVFYCAITAELNHCQCGRSAQWRIQDFLEGGGGQLGTTGVGLGLICMSF